MALNKVYKNDIGTKIRLNAGSVISAATLIQIKYKKPNGDIGTWTAVLEGTDYGYYITTTNDLDQTGKWEVQLYVVLPSWQGHGEIATLQVYKRLTD